MSLDLMKMFMAKMEVCWAVVFLAMAGFLGAARADVVSVVPLPPTVTTTVPLYQTNRAPLEPIPFLKLPPGAISPQGWLLEQLQLDANGLPGRMKEISGYLNTNNNGWVVPGGTGGWEELPYWLRGYGDLGYVLHDPTIINDAITNWIKPMLTTQVTSGANAGAFGPSPIYTAAAGSIDIWPMMPACEALQHYYDYSNDPAVIPFLTNYFNWLSNHQYAIGPGWANTRWADHLDTIYWLYDLTGQSFLLNLATNINNICGKQWLTGLPGWHNVNISQGFREPAEFWQQSGAASDLQATETDYHRFMDVFGQYPGGGWSGDENARNGYRDPRQGFETCGHVELMKSFEMLTRISGHPIWADRCEEIAFNRLPTTTSPDHTGVCYISAANAIQIDNESKFHHQFANGTMKMLALMPGVHQYRCCTHNYTMGWPYYAEALWLATMDNGLCASLYAASEVHAKVADGSAITITEDTDYPFSDRVNLTIASTNTLPLDFPLYLRVPRWCATNQAALQINGTPVSVSTTPLAFVKIQRAWVNGDTVTWQMPMHVGVTTWATNNNAVSVSYGPLDFALGIKENWSKLPVTDPNSQEFNNNWPGYQVMPESPWNYGLVLDPANPTNGIQVTHNSGPLPANPFFTTNPPVTLTVPARRIPGWKADVDHLVAQLQASPVRSTQALENITLVPMGSAHLRISTFPTIGNGTNAHDWVATPPLWPSTTASYVHDDLNAPSDQIEPASSGDTSVPRFTWWSHQGTTEWVEYDYSQRIQISSASVYWYDDGAGVRLPASWELLYKDAVGNWLSVPNPSAYGVQSNAYNSVTFSPVITRSVRLQAGLPANASSGILEWRVPIDSLTPPTVTITNPPDGALIQPGDAVQLQSAVTNFSSPIARVDYYVNGTLLGSSSASPYPLSWQPPSEGTWTFRAVATDTNALAVTSDPVNVTVVPTNTVVVAGSLYADLRPGDLANGTATWTNRTGLGDFISDGSHSPVFTTNGGVVAVQLDGSAGFKGPDTTASQLSGNSPRSIEVWVKNPSLADEETMVALGQRGTLNNNFAFNYGSNTGWGALALWADDMGWNGNPAADTWHYLVVTHDGTVAKVYADGVLKNSLASSLSTPVGPIWIGSQTADGVTPGVGWFSGYLGAIRIHTGVLSSNAIAANFARGPTASPIPSVVSGVGAVAGKYQVRLNWKPAFNATSYHVNRSEVSGGPYSLVANTVATNYTDIGLAAGKTCYYVITGMGDGDEGPPSGEVYATPVAAVSAYWDDFNDGNANGWTTYGGSWSVTNAQYTAAANPGAKSIANGTSFSNFTYEADVSIGTTGNAGLIFRVNNPGVGADAYNGYYAGIDSVQQVVLGRANGGWTQIASTPMTVTPNKAYHLKVVAVDSSLEVFVDDMSTPKISVTDAAWTSGAIGVRTYNAAATFDNVMAASIAVLTPPQIHASVNTSQLLLSWPDWADGYSAFATTNLAPPDWQPVTNNVGSSNGTFYLNLAPSPDAMRFYRLSAP